MSEAFFAYTGLINAITSIGLAVFILWRNFRSPVNRRFVLFALCVAYWAFNYYFWLAASDPEEALFLIRQAMVGAMMIPFSYTFFVHGFLQRKSLIDPINLFCSVLCLLFSNTPYFISRLEPRLMFEHWPVPGIVFHFYLFYFILNTIYAHVSLWSRMNCEKGLRRDQIRYMFAGTLIGFIGGFTNHLLWYNIPIPPVSNILVTVYIVAVAYAIARYKLMGIDVIIRRTVVFTGLFAFVFAAFFLSTFIVNEYLSHFFALGNKAAYFLSMLLVVIGYDPIRRLLVDLTDRYLFQKKYDYRKLLKDASRGISKIESLRRLLGLVVHFITMKIRVRNAAILMRKKETRDFWLGFQRGYAKNYFAYRLEEKHPLIKFLKQEKEALSLERIQYALHHEKFKYGKKFEWKEGDLKAIAQVMQEFEAVCCIPSFLGHELQNVLILGEKKSGDSYSGEDLNVLFTLAQESAIAIENASLFDEANQKTRELEVINEQLEYSKDKLIKALKETETANRQLQDAQAQLVHEQKMATLGRLAASVGHEVNNPLTILSMNVSRAILKYRKNPEIKLSEALDLFQKMEQNIARIKAVVNTLTGLLKKSEKGKFEPLSLKLILEETLPLVQFQTYLDNLTGTEVEFEVPANIPLIRGDLERLQEVFLNLFINAYHAMSGKRNRRIRVVAEMDPEDPGLVAVHFTDNGSGMTEETQKKIFNYGFTTKPPGKGSGMGLYMCKYIIEIHGGTIRVKSQVGVGTTFTLTVPAYEEARADGAMRKQA